MVAEGVYQQIANVVDPEFTATFHQVQFYHIHLIQHIIFVIYHLQLIALSTEKKDEDSEAANTSATNINNNSNEDKNALFSILMLRNWQRSTSESKYHTKSFVPLLFLRFTCRKAAYCPRIVKGPSN